MRSSSFLNYAPGAVIVALGAGSAFFPEHRLWGINHLAFLPPWGRLVALLLMAVGMLPITGRLLSELSARATRWASRYPSTTRLFLILGAIAALAVFLGLSSSTLLLGDGTHIANSLRVVGENKPLGYYLRQVPSVERVYPGTFALYTVIAWVAQRAGIDYLDGIRATVALIGVAFLYIPLIYLRRSRMPVPGRVVVAGVILTSGVVELFFGYVEVYALVILLAAAFCVGGFRALSGRSSLWWPVVCFAIGIVAHLQMLLLAPALLFLLAFRLVGSGRRLTVAAGVAAVFSVAGSLVFRGIGHLSQFQLPLPVPAFSDSVLSVVRIVDVLNELLLLAPATPLILALLWLSWRSAGPSGRGGWARLAGTIQPETLFTVVLAVPPILFLTLFPPALGMARDWDLFAICAVPIAAVAHVAAKRVTPRRWEGFMKAGVFPALVASTVLTCAWIAVNANESMSVTRYNSVLRYDTTNAAYAYENLSLYHHERGNIPGEIEALERAMEYSPNPRYSFKIGLRYYSLGDRENGITWLGRSLRTRPEDGETRQFLAQMLYFSGRYEELIDVCLEGERFSPREPNYPFLLGQAYIALGQGDAAREAFKRCLTLNPPEETAAAIKEILRSSSDG